MVNNNAFLIKAKEFLDEKDMNKFHCLSLPKFSDGTFKGIWFDKRKKDIFSSDLKICIEITKQYNEYQDNSKKRFEEKLNLFANEKNLDKFNQANKDIKFDDGKLMCLWFMTYKKFLFSCDSEICKKIQNQYQDYKKKNDSKAKTLFESRLKEFIDEPNLDKFSRYRDKYILFKDGKIMNNWYYCNKSLLSDNEEIKRQYASFEAEKSKRILKSKENFERKIEEFLNIRNSMKFKQCNDFRFSDGTLVDGWFSRNEARLSSDYETQYLIMLEQKNGGFGNNLISFKEENCLDEKRKK